MLALNPQLTSCAHVPPLLLSQGDAGGTQLPVWKRLLCDCMVSNTVQHGLAKQVDDQEQLLRLLPELVQFHQKRTLAAAAD